MAKKVSKRSISYADPPTLVDLEIGVNLCIALTDAHCAIRRAQQALMSSGLAERCDMPFGALLTELSYVQPHINTRREELISRIVELNKGQAKKPVAVAAARSGEKEKDILDD